MQAGVEARLTPEATAQLLLSATDTVVGKMIFSRPAEVSGSARVIEKVYEVTALTVELVMTVVEVILPAVAVIVCVLTILGYPALFVIDNSKLPVV